MTRTRRFMTSAFVTALLSLHGCYFGVSSGGGGCYPYCPYDNVSGDGPPEVQSDPDYDDTW